MKPMAERVDLQGRDKQFSALCLRRAECTVYVAVTGSDSPPGCTGVAPAQGGVWMRIDQGDWVRMDMSQHKLVAWASSEQFREYLRDDHHETERRIRS